MTEESLFHEALARPPQERANFLDGACAGQAELRAAVEALLAAHEQPGSLLDHPAANGATSDVVPGQWIDPANPPRLTEGPGTRIGPYKLLQLLGEGGMGAVYMAEQEEPVKRRVALKIIKAGMDSTRVIARFEAERQALAMMDHPNIAKVLDAGTTESGRPYFVMELVKGIPITKFCDQEHLTPRERLELFTPVCQAVQHAHQKGIIHRDIKPSNVMIALYDGKPVPKVIDFGVAKATAQKLTERTMFTEVGQIVGTLEYMAPEQAELNNLDIDTRADIYSLGVLLYELLTGSTPFTAKQLRSMAFTEMLRMIRESEPLKPSTKLSGSQELPTIAANRKLEPARLAKLVRGELDWIVMKALEKDRTRRYDTPSGLAKDVQRYLADELVEARPPSAGYRLRKFARRNRAALATAATITLLLIAGVAVSLWQAVRATQAEAAAFAAADAERQANVMALERESETRAVLGFVEEHILAAARPKGQWVAGQEGGLGRDVTLRRAIEEALKHLETSFRNQPLIEARLRMTLGSSFDYLGQDKIAFEQFQTAYTLYRLYGEPDHPDTLMSMHKLAGSYVESGRFADALPLFEETLRRQIARLGHDHPDTLLTRKALGWTFLNLGRHKAALNVHKEAQELYEARLGPEDRQTLYNMLCIGIDYAGLGRYGDALNLLQEVLDVHKRKFGPNDPATLVTLKWVAIVRTQAGERAESMPLWKEALSSNKEVLGLDHHETLACMCGLAGASAAAGREDEAISLYEEMLALLRKKLGPEHADTLCTMINLAELLATASDMKLQDRSRALALAQEAVKLSQEGLEFWATRGIASYQTDDWKGAKEDLQKTCGLRKVETSEEFWNQAANGFFLAMAHWQLGEKDQAHAWYGKAVQWMEKNKADPRLMHFKAKAAKLLELEKKD